MVKLELREGHENSYKGTLYGLIKEAKALDDLRTNYILCSLFTDARVA